MAAAVGLPPPSKRPRLTYAVPPQTDLKKIGKDVFTVFSLWKRVHSDDEQITPAALATSLRELTQGHVAAQCALASVLPRMLRKVGTRTFQVVVPVQSVALTSDREQRALVQVAVTKEVQLQSVSAILGAIHTAPQVVQDAAADAVLPIVRGLLCQEAWDSLSTDTVKDTFKALALSILVLCSTCPKHADTLIPLASSAFECMPYWFIIALTDALEDGDHPALKGAVAFGKRRLLSGSPGNTFFMVSESQTSALLPYVSNISRS
jgi:hypothetical protein